MRYNIDEILAMAEQIERNGAAFYRRGAQIAQDPQVVALMEELARWEDGHQRLFGRIRVALGAEGGLPDPEDQAQLYLSALAGSHVFGPDRQPEQVLRGDESAVQILDLALRFEADSINFFAAMRSLLPDGHQASHVDALIKEELGHVAFIERARRRLARESEPQ